MNGYKHTLVRAGSRLLALLPLHRLLRPLLGGSGLILVMHRVLPPVSGPRIQGNARMEISPEFLAQVLDFFQELDYDIISIDAVPQRLARGRGNRPFVVFTFDDGYADAAEIIAPLFRSRGLPFTVYVVSDFPDRRQLLWWYMLEDLVLARSSLSFSWKGREYHLDISDENAKEAAWQRIRELILAVPPEGREERVDAIFSPYSIRKKDYDRQMMSWEQVRALAADPLVTIGAHTRSHPNLRELAPDRVLEEIRQGRERLEQETGKEIRHFAYPFGSRAEVGAREIALAHQCGFTTMTTVREGCLFPAHLEYLHCLPRVEITGRHQNLALVDIRRCGLSGFLRNRLRRVVTE